MTACALPGCERPVPALALQHGDPYCSSACFRRAHGTEVSKPRTCLGCGGPPDAVTPGCMTCVKRHEARELERRRKAAAA